jgi:hypothetical protein
MRGIFQADFLIKRCCTSNILDPQLMAKSALLPPKRAEGLSRWFPQDRPAWKRPGTRIVVLGIFGIVAVPWLLSQFFQLRGYVNIFTSRLCLAGIVVILGVNLWLWLLNLDLVWKLKFSLGVILTAGLIGGAFLFDSATLQSPSFSQPNDSWHELPEEQAGRFISALKGQLSPTQRIHVACPASDEETCTYAARFPALFYKAGWPIDGDGAQRVTLMNPKRGVVLYLHSDGSDKLSDSHGWTPWVRITPSVVTLCDAFGAIGIKPDQGFGNSVTEDEIIIYFGLPKEDNGIASPFCDSINSAGKQNSFR